MSYKRKEKKIIVDEDGIRDIYNTKVRYDHQRKQLQKETSKTNFRDWQVYDAWLQGAGRKLPTRVKQTMAMRRVLSLRPVKNLKNLSKNDIIEMNSKIVQSDYAISTKIQTQLFFRQFLEVFKKTKQEKNELHYLIKVLPEPSDGDPDSDEAEGKTISFQDYQKIYKNMPHSQIKIMVKVLFSTGMRITELYNILPERIQFIKKKLWFFELPPLIFGWKGAWIYTRGKRTNSKKDGKYLYFMSFFVNDFWKYISQCKTEYAFDYSYGYFLSCLKSAMEKENINYSVHPHLFRHTVATRLFKNCQDQTVKKMMNWAKDSNMSMKYSHIKKSDVVEATDHIRKMG